MKIKNSKYKGFTLIELMIAVAILGIISAIAIPSYTEYVRKAKRTDGKSELLRIAQLQESFFVQNLTYANSLNTEEDGSGLGLGSGSVLSEQEEYKLTMEAKDSGGGTCTGLVADACTSYTLTAAPQGGQANDKCKSFTITNTGVKSIKTSGTPSADLVKRCWK